MQLSHWIQKANDPILNHFGVPMVHFSNPFQRIALDEGVVIGILQTDLQRRNLACKGILWNKFTHKLICDYGFPSDHPCAILHITKLPGSVAASVHKKRWFSSPFDAHTNKEIDKIIEISWELHQKSLEEGHKEEWTSAVTRRRCRLTQSHKRHKGLLVDCRFGTP